MIVPLIDLKAQYRSIADEIGQAIQTVLDSQKFILDHEVEQFEKALASFVNARFAVGCASGTDSILLSLLALGVEPGDEVITPAYSFFSTAGMISWLKARPVFVDIDPQTYLLKTDEVHARVTSRTRAILAVHLFGQCCRIEELVSLNLPIIEDAAQAIGSQRNGKPAGALGTMGCFSFFPTKNLGGYGDGGIITTDDESMARKMRVLRAHGQESQQYHHTIVGTNSRLDELQAAVLRVKLNHLKQWNSKRNMNEAYYRQRLEGLPVELSLIDTVNSSNSHQFVIRIEKRDQLKAFLADRGIGTAVYYPVPLPLQPCFSELGHKPGDFPNSEKCAATSLALPVFPELSEQQLEYVVDQIRNFFGSC